MVTVYLAAGSPTRKAVEEVIPSDQLPRVVVETVAWNETPQRADMVLTTNALSSALEGWAGRKGAFLVVLPEAGRYLADKVMSALVAGTDLVLVDARLQKVKV